MGVTFENKIPSQQLVVFFLKLDSEYQDCIDKKFITR